MTETDKLCITLIALEIHRERVANRRKYHEVHPIAAPRDTAAISYENEWATCTEQAQRLHESHRSAQLRTPS